MKAFLKAGHKSALLIALMLVSVGTANTLTAEAKKKSAGPDPAAVAAAELKKGLDPINDQLNKLMVKIQSRALLSPDEAGQLADIKYKLLDIMGQFPQNPQIAKPIYQAGVLFNEREEYNDAYELFNFLAQGFPATPYGAKAKGQIQQLEKKFGSSHFAVEAAAPPPAADAPKPAADKSAKK